MAEGIIIFCLSQNVTTHTYWWYDCSHRRIIDPLPVYPCGELGPPQLPGHARHDRSHSTDPHLVVVVLCLTLLSILLCWSSSHFLRRRPTLTPPTRITSGTMRYVTSCVDFQRPQLIVKICLSRWRIFRFPGR